MPGPRLAATLTAFFETRHVTVHIGDALATLRTLPAESVDCCVTSPPYFGLRDYGTATWAGGSADCTHSVGGQVQDTKAPGAITTGQRPGVDASRCRLCGATRIDAQVGLESTPDAYVAVLVEVFREVRRVLRPHGTLWLNLGDSYAAHPGQRKETDKAGEKQQTKRGSTASPSRYVEELKAKDMVGIPWRVAFALQADGWYLRSDIIWAKKNPMPESVTDRPTKSHEYIFLLSKSPTYFFDQDAVREQSVTNDPRRPYTSAGAWQLDGRPEDQRHGGEDREGDDFSSRNIRSVWTIATQPYPEAHFATFPRELPERCIKAGCPEQVCSTCGKARERIVEIERVPRTSGGPSSAKASQQTGGAGGAFVDNLQAIAHTVGITDCGHDAYVPGIVLDPFAGSGTTLEVARDLGRRSIGIELSAEYAKLIVRRVQQEALF